MNSVAITSTHLIATDGHQVMTVENTIYGVEETTGRIDYDKLEAKAKEVKPKMIICGASAYSRDWDYAKLRSVADEVGALLLADISHPSGLIAKGLLIS